VTAGEAKKKETPPGRQRVVFQTQGEKKKKRTRCRVGERSTNKKKKKKKKKTKRKVRKGPWPRRVFVNEGQEMDEASKSGRVQTKTVRRENNRRRPRGRGALRGIGSSNFS